MPGSWANSRSAIETAASAEPPSIIPLYVLHRILTPNAHKITRVSLNLPTVSTVNPPNPRDGIRVG
jgi:hypothetical protein